MKVSRILLTFTVMLCVSANAQWYNVTFRGVSYAQDGSGNLVPTPLTERSIIDAASEYRSVPTNNMALIYHVEAGGDSIKVVDKTTQEQFLTMFLFAFGTSLGRTAVTNSAGTEIRGVEYVYTQNSTRLSTWNDHSMGAVVLNKRIMTDGVGNVRVSVDGQHLQWCVLAEGNHAAQTCTGSFETGTLFTPQ